MICFVVALRSEADSFINNIDNKKEYFINDKPVFEGYVNGKHIALALSGVGKVNAALTTQLMIDKFSPDIVINFGTCGGTNNSVKILDYYLITKCIQYDFDITEIDNVEIGYIQEYDRRFFETYTNNIDFLEKSVLATADKFTDDPEIINLINNSGCSVRDMEGGAIAQVCTSNNIPLIMIKGISDVTGSGTAQEQFFKNLKTVGNGFNDIINKLLSVIK